jgi:hypothetical protein
MPKHSSQVCWQQLTSGQPRCQASVSFEGLASAAGPLSCANSQPLALDKGPPLSPSGEATALIQPNAIARPIGVSPSSCKNTLTCVQHQAKSISTVHS